MSELHVIALSGGKDSTAMALRLAEVEPRDYVYVCTPTGNELPEMFAHWRKLGEMLNAHLTPVIGGTLEDLIKHYNALPNWRHRWCTRLLKIEPFAAWLIRHSKEHNRIISYVGLRADEEEREGGDYSDVPHVERRFPLREWGWGLSDVLGYLEQRNVTIPRRTDCALCFFQTLGEWYNLWRDQPAEFYRGERLEALTEHTFRSPGRDSWPASLKDLRARFEGGFIPRGADVQPDLFKQTQCRVCRT